MNPRVAALALVVAVVSPSALAHDGHTDAPSKRIYLAPDDHTDYVWTADAATYQAAFLEMLDYYLDQIDLTAAELPPYQARWNTDGSYWLWTFERNRSATQFSRLVGRLKDGHLSSPLNPLAMVWGATPTEAVLRGMYYPGSLERRYDLRFRVANQIENQSQPFGLYSLWAGSGALYSWHGICACASEIPDAFDRPADIFWGQGHDGSRLLVKWNSALNGNQSMGGYAEARDPFGIVDYVDLNAAFRARYSYNRIGAFGKGWDDLKTLTTEFVTAAKTKTTAARQVLVSNEEDFFADFIGSGDSASIPTLSVSHGVEWELFIATLAEQSARVKRATEQLRAAEALASLVSLVDPCLMQGRESARDTAFMALGLYYEHDIGGDGPVPNDVRRDWQKDRVLEIESYVDTLKNDAATRLAQLIQKSGPNRRFYAFNPLSWVRSDIADLPFADTATVHVVEVESGQEVPSQIVTVEGQRRLRVLASALPAVGYKTYEIVPGAGATFGDAATVTGGNTLETALYRVTLAPRGAIASLIDKTRANREFVRVIGGRAMNDLGPGTGTLSIENQGPVSVTVKAVSSAPIQHTTRLTLSRDSSRIDVSNEITQNFDDTYTWAFGFNLDAPDVHHEEVGAILRAKPAPTGDYATRAIRYDWLTLNHFFDIAGSGGGMTLSNADLYFMKLGTSTTAVLDTVTPQVSLLAGGRVAFAGGGIRFQGGDTLFRQRVALTGRNGYDPGAAMRFALEHQNPPVVRELTGGTLLPPTSYSLLSISDPDVMLWALKPSEEGVARGLTARLWNVAETPRSATLTLSAGASGGGALTSHLETPEARLPLAAGQVTLNFAREQLRTAIDRLTVTSPVPSPQLSVTKSGSNAVLSWNATGQGCYEALSATRPHLGGASRLFSGAATTATDSQPVTPGTAVFYVVE